MASAVSQYYNDRQEMPAGLEDVASDYDPVLQDFLRDPETGVFYEYNPLSENRYALCAVFSLDFSAQPDAESHFAIPAYVGEKGPVDPFLAGYHADRTCFSLEANVTGTCRLMTNTKAEGEFGCFGCSGGTCSAAPANWVSFVAAPSDNPPYQCIGGSGGCEMVEVKK